MMIGIRYATRTDVGMLRDGNEDSAYAGRLLLAVADGMGGHAAGEVASAAVIEELRALDAEMPADRLVDALEQAVQRANQKVRALVQADPARQGMGSTLTALLWSGSHLAVVQVGDSRCYLLRGGDLYQITHDQTLVQLLLDQHKITPDQVATHPMRSMLLQALDGRADFTPALQLRTARAGDRYLLCSDGLWGQVTAGEIHKVLTGKSEPDQAVAALVDAANASGGPDNITCIVADVVDLSGEDDL